MKLTKVNILILSSLILISVLSGGWYLSRQNKTLGLKTQTAQVKEISPQEADTLIKNHKDSGNFTIIDVRTPGEFASGHLAEVTNLNYQSSAFGEELEKLDKNNIYLVYCQTGGRSKKVLDIMKGLGFKEVYGMVGGIAQWSADGLPTVR